LKNSDRGQRARRLGATLLLLLFPAVPLQARGRSEAWATNQYATAQRLRETLNSRPSAEQSRSEYQHVIAAYRRVYYGSPASSKADPSVVAVAELLTEMGHRFDDNKALHSAIGQYKFLRREYPGSRDRFDALFSIGQIYQDDLKDSAQAKLTFEEFLHHYPHHHLADDARKALAEPVQQASLKSRDSNDSIDRSGASKMQAAKPAPRPAVKAASSEDTSNDSDVDDSNDDSSKATKITSIRHSSNPDTSRVIIGLEKGVKFDAQRIENPDRIFFDLRDTTLPPSLLGKTIDVDDSLLKKIRVAQFEPGKSRIVLEVADRSEYTTSLLSDPPRLIVDIHGKDVQSKTAAGPGSQDKKTAKPTLVVSNNPRKTVVEDGGDDDDSAVTVAKLDPPQITPAAKPPIALAGPPPALPTLSKSASRGKRKPPAIVFPDVREASPTANGDRSLIRALGLKIGKIVIDPGHGGHDTGTIGPNGLEEKDLVLDVGRRLGKLLQTRMGADVIYTRKDDTFIPLETRTSIANQEQADLFVSIHANSSRDRDARGVETYYLNFTSSAEALDVAARENAASDKSIHELQDLVKKIALKEKIDESREFASNVQRALHTGLAAKSPGIRDRGVKKAPFIVLIGANMPSILAEVSFVSNPGDERRLQTSDYRQRIAESLYRGISKYVSGLSGVKVASKIDKTDGQ
jgi:N-acetylmuramoyl-L-alanine amidase